MPKTTEHICVISMGYPTDENPVFAFVDQLVCALANLGVKCSVIAPQSISRSIVRGKPQNPTMWSKKTKLNNTIDIYQPHYISVSNKKVLGVDLNQLFFERAAEQAYERMKEKPTVMYGHFWNCGLIAAKVARRESLPVYVACGESKITILKNQRLHKISRLLEYITGVVSVSSENKDECIKLGLVTKEKIIVLPNGIDQGNFYKMNKGEVRAELGYSENDFIVAFTGAFIERKGSKRLSDALNRLDNVKSIFIGSGNTHPPDCEGILFCGKLAHKEIAKYLNCADVFVLPTLAEGCCNAIIEAMACGLPIVSSRLPFNDDILNDNNSIRINPQSVDEIANAIKSLRDNPTERRKMAEGSLSTASSLLIEERAKKILNYIYQTKGRR